MSVTRTTCGTAGYRPQAWCALLVVHESEASPRRTLRRTLRSECRDDDVPGFTAFTTCRTFSDPPYWTAAIPVERAPAPVVATLVANHRAFLSFIERRVSSRDVAEEILQNALVKNVEKFDTVRETAVGWFYKVLRNAVIDHRRRKTVADRGLDGYASDVAVHEPDEELHHAVCKCVAELASTPPSTRRRCVRRDRRRLGTGLCRTDRHLEQQRRSASVPRVRRSAKTDGHGCGH